MSYLEQLKKLNKPTIPADITDKSPFVPFVSTYGGHISENIFLPDSKIKSNQSRCSDCINLNSCPSARNLKGECPSNFKYGITITGKDL